MSVEASQFRSTVVLPALTALIPTGIPYTQFAEDLLMATAAQESILGTFLTQVGGPAVGVFMIEPASLMTVYERLSMNQMAVLGSMGGSSMLSALAALPTNLLLAAVICRLFYWQVRMPLPTTSTLANLWNYYKTYYNTTEGAATLPQFMAALKIAHVQVTG